MPRPQRMDVFHLAYRDGAGVRRAAEAVVVSPDELNAHLSTVLVAPLLVGEARVFRPRVRFLAQERLVALDQIRCTADDELIVRLGRIDEAACGSVLRVLVEMFS